MQPISGKKDLSSELEQVLKDHGRKSKTPCHTDPPEHQVVIERTRQARDLRIAVSAEFKPSLQSQKAVKNAWCALR